MPILALVVWLLFGSSGTAYAALDDSDAAVLDESAELLAEFDPLLSPFDTSSTAGSERGTALLAEIDQRGIAIPSLARMMLSGAWSDELQVDDTPTTLAILFATASEQLEAAADDLTAPAEPDTSSGAISSGFSLPLGTVIGVLALMGILMGSIGWYRRRATRMEALSLVDPLTGLANRRRLDQDLARFDAERVAARQPVSLAMVDVDEFKRFNDTFGHAEGDVALQTVSTTIAKSIRPQDSVYRYGGEEFLVLLRNAPQQEAAHVCEGIRLAVAGLPNQVTVSIGVATGIEEPLTTLTVAADEALYKAKSDGRNRIVATSVLNRVGARVSDI